MLGFVVLKKMNDFAQCDMDDVTIPHDCVLEKNIVYYVLCHQFQRGIDYSVVIRRIRSHFVKLTVSKRFIINMYTHSHLLGDPPLHTDIQREYHLLYNHFLLHLCLVALIMTKLTYLINGSKGEE